MVENLPASAGDTGLIPGWEEPLEEEMATLSNILAGKNPMDRGVWQAAVCGAANRQTDLNMHAHQIFVASMWDLSLWCMDSQCSEVLAAPWPVGS